MSMQTELDEAPLNPLDKVEEVLSDNNWVFSRMNDDELVVHVQGKGCDFRLFFIWQEDMNALQFCCQYDLVIKDQNFMDAARALMAINEKLWMGHFDVPKETGIPTFRHTCLIRGFSNGGHESIEDLVEISLAQCERNYPLFHLLSTDPHPNEANLNLALMETRGES